MPRKTSDPARRSAVPRRRRPRAGTEHGNLYGERAESIDPVSLSSDEMQGRRLRSGTAGGRSAAATVAGAAAGGRAGRPRSQGDEGDGQARKQRRRRADPGGAAERGGRTWRGRLEEGSGSSQSKGKGLESASSISSGKKFEDLENYLRGAASASAAKREKRRRGLGQGSGGGGDSCGGGTMTDGSSLSFAEGDEVHTRSSSSRVPRGIPMWCVTRPCCPW